MGRIICAKSGIILSKLQADSFDLLCTDPPYGMNFMGKEWDKALPDKEIWKECLRVLKPGAFAFVMCIPRADCLWRMMRDLELAGFIVKFTPMYWTYASGFPKAQNIGKAIDKKLGKKRKRVGEYQIPSDSTSGRAGKNFVKGLESKDVTGFCKRTGKRTYITEPASKEAKELDGSFAGFQPKPAVEVIIVAMKPLSEKNYPAQALKNKKGITWIDDCRIPFDKATDEQPRVRTGKKLFAGATNKVYGKGIGNVQDVNYFNSKGRFPANLLVSDDVLNDGKDTKSPKTYERTNTNFTHSLYEVGKSRERMAINYGDSGSFSRFFDIDIWFSEMLKQRLGNKFERASKTFPFLLSPKASKTEKWFYCRVCKSTQEAAREKEHHQHICWCKDCQEMISQKKMKRCKKKKHKLIPNLIYHPTVKPLRLMSYLVTLGSREGDKVLDPFAGTCKTAMACEILKRNYVMIDSDAIALKLGRAGLDALENPPLRKKLLKRIE